MTNDILRYIMNSKSINKVLDKMIAHYYIDDFKSHFYLQILEMNKEKLEKAYKEKYIDKLCYRIIRNQYLSKSSSFWKLYRNNGFYKEVRYTDYIGNGIDSKILDESDDKEYPTIFNHNTKIKIESLSSDDIDEISGRFKQLVIELEIDKIGDILIQINELLRHIHYYHSELFRLYYIEGLSYKKIEKKTGIYYQTVSYSVKNTLKYIKENIII